MTKASDEAYVAWANGDSKPVEDLITTMRAGGAGMEGMSVEGDARQSQRELGGQIEKLLKEEGRLLYRRRRRPPDGPAQPARAAEAARHRGETVLRPA